MAKFKNDKGLTLIELLITIAVLAVVSAIALPVINNVVSSSNSNAAVQTQNDVTDFITKYNAAGETLFVSTASTGTVLSGYVDTDGDNTIDSNELVDTLTIDSKFSASVAGTSDNVGGNYTNDGVTGATVTLAAGGATGGTTSPFGTASQKLTEGGMTIMEGMEYNHEPGATVLYYDLVNSTAYYTSILMGYDVATLMNQTSTSFELPHAGINVLFDTSEASSGHITATLFGQTRHYYNVDASGNIIPFA